MPEDEVTEYVYIYQVEDATGRILKVEELDQKTGQRTDIPMLADESYQDEDAAASSPADDGIRKYIYHVKEATGEIVKVEELDDTTGRRSEVPMTAEMFGYQPYELEIDTYGRNAYR